MRRRVGIWVLLVALLAAVVGPGAARAEAPKVPLVLIHGMMGSAATTWASATPWFEQQGYVSGKTLFAIDLGGAEAEALEMGVFADTTRAAAEIRIILKTTGATQVDLLGKDRGGLVVRLLATGETSVLVRRAVTLDAPHAGVLPAERLYAELDLAKIDRGMVDTIPVDMKAESVVLRTLAGREARFADRRAPALAIASTWLDGHDPVLAGHDGFVTVESQLAWPGARQITNKIGVTPEALNDALAAGLGPFALATSIPQVIAADQPANLQAAFDFFMAADVAAPARACEPACQDWSTLSGHWSEATVKAMLPDRLPYDLDAKGQRQFDPNRPMTRAEFAFALAQAVGLQEQLAVTKFTDLHGHWALGYVEAAVAAKLVNGLSADSFGPDAPLNRAQAATLITRAKKLVPKEGKSRFADARGHWAEANIEAAAEAGILKGDERGFRPNDPVTMAEAAVILSRSFSR